MLVQEHHMKRLIHPWLIPLAAVALAGCTQFPELDHTQTSELEATDYPALVPLGQILLSQSDSVVDPNQERGDLDARLTNLRARADRMRAGVLSPQEKRRLEAGLR